MPFPKNIFINFFCLGFYLLFLFDACGKGFSNIMTFEDSIVKIHGYVLDTISENPDSLSIKAKIIFESLPHGSEIGIITTNDSSGYYEYYLNLNNSYRIVIQSENHTRYFENLNPRITFKGDDIIRNFYLKPEVKEDQVIRLNKLIFEQGKSHISPESYEELNRLVN